MNAILPVTSLPAAPIPLGPRPAAAILAAANLLLPHLERGQPVDTAMLRAAMETAFGARDVAGVSIGVESCPPIGVQY